VAETTVKRILLRVSTHWQSDGTSVSILAEDMSRNKCFFQVPISYAVHVLYPFVTYLLTLPRIIIVTCIPIARQRLGKHIPAKRTHATEGRPLLGNGPVNTPF
jgi:hypothetical protein